MAKLAGVIKHYAWGGTKFIPDLLGLDNAAGKPFAEYWLGTHVDGPAHLIVDGQRDLALDQYLTARARPGALPFLLKVLDVREMLSIQMHPDKSTAEAGFAREDQQGIARTDAARSYRDANHKPELMVALSDFWLLQGFRPSMEIDGLLEAQPEFAPLRPVWAGGGLAGLFEHIMTSEQSHINAMLKPLGKRIKPLLEAGELGANDLHYWAAKAFIAFNRKGICDRSILLLYLMNLVHLRPGEGIYQAPGVLHAYLHGQSVECMATSDNVIRAGLTRKFVNVPELLRLTRLDRTPPVTLESVPTDEGITSFHTPAHEFQLSRGTTMCTLSASSSPRILLCVRGQLTLRVDGQAYRLQKGDAHLIMGSSPCEISPEVADTLYFIAQEGP